MNCLITLTATAEAPTTTTTRRRRRRSTRRERNATMKSPHYRAVGAGRSNLGRSQQHQLLPVPPPAVAVVSLAAALFAAVAATFPGASAFAPGLSPLLDGGGRRVLLRPARQRPRVDASSPPLRGGIDGADGDTATAAAASSAAAAAASENHQRGEESLEREVEKTGVAASIGGGGGGVVDRQHEFVEGKGKDAHGLPARLVASVGDNENGEVGGENAPSEWKGWLRRNVFMGMEPTPEIVAIATIYFVEGALGLARLAQTYLLKDELHLGPAELSALTGAFALPWTIKPLYGFLSDGFPLFGYRRKSYLIAAGGLGALSYAALGLSGLWSDGGGSTGGSAVVGGTVAALLLSSACIAMSDVVADGIVVRRTREESADPAVAGGLQSLCWGSSALGGLLSAYFSGSLLEVMSVRDVFGIAAVLPLLVAIIASRMDEEPVVSADAVSDGDDDSNPLIEGVREQVTSLVEAFKKPGIWRPALFIFLWQATPTSDGAFFYFLSNDLGLGPEFMGRVRLVTATAGLAGVWLYQKYFRTAKIKDILFWSTLASFPLGMVPLLLITHANRALGIPDTSLIYGDDVALATLGEISFLPTLVLAARLCPPGVEAVLFATLMSIFNGASTVGTEIGAGLTKVFGVTESNFDNL